MIIIKSRLIKLETDIKVTTFGGNCAQRSCVTSISTDESEKKDILCKICGKGVLHKEDRTKQFNRIKTGLKDIFPKYDDEKISEYSRNFIGYGPNYMFECDNCHVLKKIIPDGRDRE
jgi:hypothetical protein